MEYDLIGVRFASAVSVAVLDGVNGYPRAVVAFVTARMRFPRASAAYNVVPYIKTLKIPWNRASDANV